MCSQSWVNFVGELGRNLSQDLNFINIKKEIDDLFFASIYPKNIERWFKSNFYAKVKVIEDVQRHRTQGNKYFASMATILNALECYNKAIIHFSYNDKHNAMDLALSHGNRSAIFFEFQKYQECIIDIKYALAIEKLWGLEFPLATKLKLLWRKLQSYHKLGSTRDATRSLKFFLLCLEDDRVSTKLKEKYEKLLATEPYQVKNFGGSGQSSYRRQRVEDFPFLDSVPETLWNQMGPDTSLLSTQVSIHINDYYGRHFVATSKLKPGDIVLIDRAYATIPIYLPTDDFALRGSEGAVKVYRCHNCYLETLAFIPCTTCTAVVYCSTKCKLESWINYHRYLCGYVPLFEQAGATEHSLRMILRAGLIPLIEKASGKFNSEPIQRTREKRGTKFLKKVQVAEETFTSHDYCSGYEWIHGLSYNPFSDKVEDALFIASAYVIGLFLRKVGFCDPRDLAVKRRLRDLIEGKGRNAFWLEDDLLLDRGGTIGAPKGSHQLSYEMRGLDIKMGESDILPMQLMNDPGGLKFLTRVAYRHLHQVYSNAYMSHMYPIGPPIAQLIDGVDSSYDFRLQKIASCLFPLASLINHSCQPNTFADFLGDVMIVKVIEPVDKGEQLFTSYGPVFGGRPFLSRQKRLKEQYGFVCKCRACSDIAKIRTETDREAVKCQYCGGPVPMELYKCLSCGRMQNNNRMITINKKYNILVNLRDIMTEPKLVGDPDPRKVLPALLEFVDDHLYAPDNNMSVGEACDIYARYAIEQGEVELAYALSLRHIHITGNLYGKQSLEYGVELSSFLALFQSTTPSNYNPISIENLGSYFRELGIKSPTGKKLQIKDLEKRCHDVLLIFKRHFAVENILCREADVNLNNLKIMINDYK